MNNAFFKSVSILALSCAGLSLSVQSAVAQPSGQSTSLQQADEFAQFSPEPSKAKTRLDYSIWDEALRSFVVTMGRSLREGASRVDAGIGTRRVYGHDSRLRLEGNRVGFSFFTDDITQSLVDYREDLERTAEIVDISKLGKNEQLAFWLNLHNVAIIEQIALQYPMGQPSRMKIGENGESLDDAKFITVSGVKMSPRDIRTKIVYPNWKDPRVIYGFFRGDIGGPSIQRSAFNGTNLTELLDISAREFVNSLRGADKSGSTMRVSTVYDEARPFYFADWPASVRTHFGKFAREEVTELLGATTDVVATIYEADIADLSNGERDPNYNYIQNAESQGIRIPTAIARLMVERQQKIDEIIKRGQREGTVTFVNIDLDGKPVEPEVIE